MAVALRIFVTVLIALFFYRALGTLLRRGCSTLTCVKRPISHRLVSLNSAFLKAGPLALPFSSANAL